MNEQERLAFKLEQRIIEGRVELAKFSARFAEDPIDALEWADNMTKAAANMRVAKMIRARIAWAILCGVEMQNLVKVLDMAATSDIEEGLRSGSTSPMSNMAKRVLGGAWMRLWSTTHDLWPTFRQDLIRISNIDE